MVAIQDVAIREAKQKGTLEISGPHDSRICGQYWRIVDESGTIETAYTAIEAEQRIEDALRNCPN